MAEIERYVVLNCPTLMGNRLCYSKVIRQCADCTDCVTKQVIEKCKEVENIENVKTLYDAAQSGMFLQANRILKLFDIEEINK